MRAAKRPGIRRALVLLAAVSGLACGAPPDDRPVLRPGFSESAPQAAILLTTQDFLGWQPLLFAELVVKLQSRVPVLLLGPPRDEERVRQLFAALGLPLQVAGFVPVAPDTMWTRDFGPFYRVSADGRVTMLDFRHPEARVRGRDRRERDDRVPEALARAFGLPLESVPLRLGAGNFVGNGDGLYVSTFAAVLDNMDLEFTLETMGRELAKYFAFHEWIVLEPLKREPTHDSDLMLTFPVPGVALVGEMDPAVDPENARILDESAALLARKRTGSGPLSVRRIPMPPPKDGVWRSYTNVIYANGLVLVPRFGDVPAEVEARVHAVYRELLPGWQVEPVPADALARRGGLLHCVSHNVPGFVALPASLRSDRLAPPPGPSVGTEG